MSMVVRLEIGVGDLTFERDEWFRGEDLLDDICFNFA